MAASIRTIRSVTCLCRPRRANGTARSLSTRAMSGPRCVWATAGRSLVSTHSTAIFEFSIEDTYYKAFEWDPKGAGEKLRPLLEKCWFSEALIPRLKFRPYEEGEALS